MKPFIAIIAIALIQSPLSATPIKSTRNAAFDVDRVAAPAGATWISKRNANAFNVDRVAAETGSQRGSQDDGKKRDADAFDVDVLAAEATNPNSTVTPGVEY
jgi:hypothetical protein